MYSTDRKIYIYSVCFQLENTKGLIGIELICNNGIEVDIVQELQQKVKIFLLTGIKTMKLSSITFWLAI